MSAISSGSDPCESATSGVGTRGSSPRGTEDWGTPGSGDPAIPGRPGVGGSLVPGADQLRDDGDQDGHGDRGGLGAGQEAVQQRRDQAGAEDRQGAEPRLAIAGRQLGPAAVGQE